MPINRITSSFFVLMALSACSGDKGAGTQGNLPKDGGAGGVVSKTPASAGGAAGQSASVTRGGTSSGGGTTGFGGTAASSQSTAPACVQSTGIARVRATLTEDAPFVHPGVLSTTADLERMGRKVSAAIEPWKGSWDKLVANRHAQLNYVASPQAIICAGNPCASENYMSLANDAAAAYQLALRYQLSGDHAYAVKAEAILDGWAAVLTSFSGDSNAGLRAALYGYQLAAAGELLRKDATWDPTFVKRMLSEVFYPLCSDFLKRHNGACEGNYWANWDLANLSAVIAIGVFTDKRSLFNEAVNYFYDGMGEGAIEQVIHFVHPDGSGQWQESGRDQGHATLGPMLLGVVCEIAWNQGVDLYGYAGNRALAGSEYVAAYNLGHEVPFVGYTWQSGPEGACKAGVQTVVAEAGRGEARAGWELIFNHYVKRKGLAAPFTEQYSALVRPEGGGGDYGPNSGGFDSLGFSTLTHWLDDSALTAAPNDLRPYVKGKRIWLSWTGSAGATAYEVRRAEVSCGPYELLATVSAPQRYTLDERVELSKTYYYFVTAKNALGLSTSSPEVAAMADDQLTGTVIGTPGSFGDVGATGELLFDGSLKNYFDGPDPVSWAGIDLGEGNSAEVTAVSFAPRRQFESRAVGGKFQASSVADFSSGVVDLVTLTEAPPSGKLTRLAVHASGRFRYLRYLSPSGGYGNMAEIQFHGAVLPSL